MTDVRRRAEKMTSIVNVYDQREMQSGERQAHQVNWQSVIWKRGNNLAGNFSANSSQWDPRCRAQRNPAFWEGVMDKDGLEIGYDGHSTHYCTREDHKGEAVIDLTLAHRLIMKWTLQADDHATGSDHEVIEWAVNADRQEEADHESVVVWNLAGMTEEHLEAAEKLWRELAKERAHLSAECTADEVEHEAAWCQEAMSSDLNATAKKITICTRSKRWWNADIKERRKTAC